MKTTKLTIALATFALTISSAAFVACGGDDSQPAGPQQHDASAPTDSGSNPDMGTTHMDGGSDSNIPDTGSCMSDAANCNSCVTPAQDPYNACSSATTNCVPFDPSRVPQHPTL